MLKDDPEPSEFLSLNEVVEDISIAQSGNKYSDNSTSFLPNVSIEIILSDKKLEHGRQAYTFFMLIGDVGGFNGAIIIFPAYLMSYYSAAMYQSAVYAEALIKRKLKKPRSPYTAIQQKL